MSSCARCAGSAFRFTQFANATCGTIRLKLLKIGAVVTSSVRRVNGEWELAHASLRAAQR
ncbi:MAG: hypothetical protein H5U21_07655 [Porphyrobacter sp.]|nr:hypothetical protein [Porphyrobacter sp.]